MPGSPELSERHDGLVSGVVIVAVLMILRGAGIERGKNFTLRTLAVSSRRGLGLIDKGTHRKMLSQPSASNGPSSQQ